MNRFVWIPAILGAAGLLLASGGAANAQKGGARGGAHVHPGGVHVHPGGVHVHPGGVHVHPGGGHYGGSYNRGPSISIGLGVYGPVYPYSYSPYMYDPYIVVPRAYYPAPSAIDIGAYAAPSIATPPSNTANVRVLVPDAQAKVWFDGNLTTQGGTDRLYHTPPLTAGANNTYRIRASWIQNGREMTQERVVPVAPNQTSVVDFTQPVSEGVGPPPLK